MNIARFILILLSLLGVSQSFAEPPRKKVSPPFFQMTYRPGSADPVSYSSPIAMQAFADLGLNEQAQQNPPGFMLDDEEAKRRGALKKGMSPEELRNVMQVGVSRMSDAELLALAKARSKNLDSSKLFSQPITPIGETILPNPFTATPAATTR
ncbi:MAG: hypothetical protein V4692_11975 [Bdellovibrionota bacterium]